MRSLPNRRSDACPLRSLWNSKASREVDALPFDVVPAEMQVTSKKHERYRVLYRQNAIALSGGGGQLGEFVAQQPTHIRRLLRHCTILQRPMR
jgi:hypothetical protein